MPRSSQGYHRADLAIPGTGGNYAPEVIYVRSGDPDVAPKGKVDLDVVSKIRVLLHPTLVTAVVIEVDLLKADGEPEVAADWELAVFSYTTVGIQTLEELPGCRGVRIRGKSGGTSGTQTVSVMWE